MTGGQDITIRFDDAHRLKPNNASVVYLDMKVGQVDGIALAGDGKSVTVKVHVQDNVTKFLRSGTVFWLRGASPSLSNLSALTSVLTGPTIVMEPGPGSATTHFAGLAHKPVVTGARRSTAIPRSSATRKWCWT